MIDRITEAIIGVFGPWLLAMSAVYFGGHVVASIIRLIAQ